MIRGLREDIANSRNMEIDTFQDVKAFNSVNDKASGLLLKGKAVCHLMS